MGELALAKATFNFEGKAVRVIERDGDPWFVLADVCRILEIGNAPQAARRLDEDEKATITSNDSRAGHGPQSLTIINESGLYSLILTSRKPEAKRFKKWVTSEVLPSIRRSGSYGKDPVELLGDPASLRLLLGTYAERVQSLETRVDTDRPKVDFYDQFANADGLYGLQIAGRALGQKPRKFVQWLKQSYLFYEGGALVPYVQYREQGLFEVVCTMVDDKARLRTYITPKGLQRFARELGVSVENGPSPALTVRSDEAQNPLFN